MVDLIEIIRDPAPVVEVIYPAGPQGPEGPQGPPGADSTVPGPQGPAGATGPAGPGVATGGTTGQLLTKTSAVDFATVWQNPPAADLSTVPLLAPADDTRNTFSVAAGRIALRVLTTGDTQPRFQINNNGSLYWGGGSTPSDVVVQRFAPGELRTIDAFLAISRAAAGSNAFSAMVAGDAQRRFLVDARGFHSWGDGTAAVDTTLIRGNPGRLDLTSRLHVTAASVGTAFSAITTPDTISRFTIGHDGTHNWGPGNAATDVTLARSAAGILLLGSLSQPGRLNIMSNAPTAGALSTLVSGDTQVRHHIDASGSLYWGTGTTALDATISRRAAQQLQIGDATYPTRLLINCPSGSAIDAQLAADTTPRWSVRHDGYLSWGPGNAAADVVLYRATTDILRTEDRLDIKRVNASDMAFGFSTQADANYRFQSTAGAIISFGDGTLAPDTTIQRSAAARLALTGMLTTTLGVATRTKAGTPVDADWAAPPPDGTLVVDSTANKLWARVGGVWKSVAIA